MKNIIFIILLSVMSIGASETQAKFIQFKWEAEVSDIVDAGSLLPDVGLGSTLSGYYIFDSNSPDTHGGENTADFSFSGPMNRFGFKAGSLVFNSNLPHGESAFNIGQLESFGPADRDFVDRYSMTYLGTPEQTVDDLAVWQYGLSLFTDGLATSYPDGADNLLLEPPDLSQWDSAKFFLALAELPVIIDPDQGLLSSFATVTGDLTKFARVPEPSTLMLLIPGLIGLWGGRWINSQVKVGVSS